ncbi:MAG: hypothetical protein KQI35_14225 [Bacteroidetes bacterium]|nr:hypothetical protein [Bacteroidota bacterium]
MKRLILQIAFIVYSLIAVAQSNESPTDLKKSFLFISASGGAIVTDESPVSGLGFKVGYAQEGFGRIGPRVIASIADQSNLLISFVDYEYPVKVAGGFHINPNFGFGYTQTKFYRRVSWSNGTTSVANDIKEQRDSFGINMGLSMEFLPVKRIGIRTGINSMFAFSDGSMKSFVSGGLIFLL